VGAYSCTVVGVALGISGVLVSGQMAAMVTRDEAILFLLFHHDIRENDHPDDKNKKDYQRISS